MPNSPKPSKEYTERLYSQGVTFFAGLFDEQFNRDSIGTILSEPDESVEFCKGIIDRLDQKTAQFANASYLIGRACANRVRSDQRAVLYGLKHGFQGESLEYLDRNEVAGWVIGITSFYYLQKQPDEAKEDAA